MYRKIKRTPTSLNVNETMEGETIERMIERRLNNGETAQDNIMKDLIYQPREEGVNPNYDIRNDKMELAILATDKVTKAHNLASNKKIEERKKALDKLHNKEKSTEESGSSATTLTTE